MVFATEYYARYFAYRDRLLSTTYHGYDYTLPYEGPETGETTTVPGPSGDYTVPNSYWMEVFCDYTGYAGAGVRDATFTSGLSVWVASSDPVYTLPTVSNIQVVAGADPNEDLIWPCQKNTIYYVRIGSTTGDGGTFKPCFFAPSFFGGAMDIGVRGARLPFSDDFNGILASNYPGGPSYPGMDKRFLVNVREPGCPTPVSGYTEAVIWFCCTPAGDGAVTFTTSDAIGVYTGTSVSTLTTVGAGVGTLTVTLRAGVTYHIQLASQTATGDYQLTWTPLPEDANQIAVTSPDAIHLVSDDEDYAAYDYNSYGQPIAWFLHSPDGSTMYFGKGDWYGGRSGYIDATGWHEVKDQTTGEATVRFGWDYVNDKLVIVDQQYTANMRTYSGDVQWPLSFSPLYLAPDWLLYYWRGVWSIQSPTKVFAGLYAGEAYVARLYEPSGDLAAPQQLPGPAGGRVDVPATEVWFADSPPEWNGTSGNDFPYPNTSIMGSYVVGDTLHILFSGGTHGVQGTLPFSDYPYPWEYEDPRTGTSSVWRATMPIRSTYDHRVKLNPELIWTGMAYQPGIFTIRPWWFSGAIGNLDTYIAFLAGYGAPGPPFYWGHKFNYHWLVLGVPVEGEVLGSSAGPPYLDIHIIRDNGAGDRTTFVVKPQNYSRAWFIGWWRQYMVFSYHYGALFGNENNQEDWRLFDTTTMQWGPRIYFPGKFRIGNWVDTRGDENGAVLCSGYFVDDDLNEDRVTYGIYQILPGQDISGQLRTARRWFR